MTTSDGGAPRVTRSQATTAAREALRFALGMALTGALGRKLDAADFGFVSFVGTIYALAQLALDLGSGALLAREIARDPSRERPLLEAATAWRFVLGLGAGAIVAVIAALESDPSRRFWLFVTAASLPLLAPGVSGIVFLVRQDLGPPSLLGVLLQAGMLGGALWMIDHAVLPAAFALLYVVRETTGALAIRLLARYRHGVVQSPGFLGRDTRRLFSGAVAQATSSILQTVSFHAAPFVIAACRTDDELGEFSAASRLVNPVLLLVGALAAPLLPVAAAGYRRSREAAARLTGAAITLGACLGAAGAAVVFRHPAAVLDLVYGRGTFTGGLPGGGDATAPLAALGLAFAAVAIGAPACTSLLADGGEGPLRRAFGLGLVCNAFLLAAVGLGAPLAAAGFGSCAAESAVALVAVTELRRRGAVVFAFRNLLWPPLVFAAVGIVVEFVARSLGGMPPYLPAAVGGAACLVALAGAPGRAFRSALAECSV